MEALRLSINTDQLHITNLASSEHLIRRVVQIEVAVSRNPKQPDFSGLELLMDAPVNESGAARTQKFTARINERLKERAQVWKQQRLYAEERRHLNNQGKGGGKSKKSKKGDGGPPAGEPAESK